MGPELRIVLFFFLVLFVIGFILPFVVDVHAHKAKTLGSE